MDHKCRITDIELVNKVELNPIGKAIIVGHFRCCECGRDWGDTPPDQADVERVNNDNKDNEISECDF
jgi:hypothetical protein